MTTEMNPRPNSLRMAWRLARRELRAGGYSLLAMSVAIVISVAAMVSVSSFAERVELATQARAAELMGGDVRVRSNRSLDSWLSELPQELRPDAVVLEMQTMVMAKDELKLVELKAVGSAYPLVGELLIENQGRQFAPPNGQAWVESSLLDQMNLAVGDTLAVGYSEFAIAGVIENEPDRVGGIFSIGPRVMINMADLPTTQLVTPASRVKTSALYRVSPGGHQPLVKRLQAEVPEWAVVEQAARDMEMTAGIMRRASDYLRLTVLAGLVLAGAAIAIATNSLVSQRTESIAILRCLGTPARVVFYSYLMLVAIVGTLAGGIGALAGHGLQYVLADLMKGLVLADLPPPTFGPLSQGWIAGIVVALAFALPPLSRLRDILPMQVLRRGTASRRNRRRLVLYALPGLAMLAALIRAVMVHTTISVIIIAVLAALVATFTLLGLVVFAVLRNMKGHRFIAWKHAVTGLVREPGPNLFAIAALSCGVMATLAPFLVQSDLIEQWRRQIPAGAPNFFLIDVQPHQVDGVSQLLAQQGATGFQLRPMIRARLDRINGAPISELDLPEGRAQQLAERENNLTFQREPEPHNPIIAGRWWDDAPEKPELSVELDWAESLGVGLGDRMVFTVEGRSIEATVTNVRTVEWESMETNFFVIMSHGALEEFPATYVTSYGVDDAQAAQLEKELVRQFPNVTPIDLRRIVETMQGMIDRMSAAVIFLSAFILLAGCSVLLAVVLGERGKIAQEVALLRALGAQHRLVRRIFTLRFALIGAVAALLGIGAAVFVGYVICLYSMEIAYQPNVSVLGASLAVAVLLVAAVGIAGTWRALHTPPKQVLQELR